MFTLIKEIKTQWLQIIIIIFQTQFRRSFTPLANQTDKRFKRHIGDDSPEKILRSQGNKKQRQTVFSYHDLKLIWEALHETMGNVVMFVEIKNG
jgi:hypothetical protein